VPAAAEPALSAMAYPRGLILGGGRLGRNQDFAELDGFRLFHLALVLVVELLLFFLGNG